MNMRDLIHDHETVADAAAVEAGGDPSPDTAAPQADVTEGTPSPEAAPPTPAADPLAGLGLDAEQLRDLAELAPILRQAMQQQPGPDTGQQQPSQAPEIDPFADDFGAQLANLMRGIVQEAIAPVTQRHETEVLTEAENRALDIIRDDASRNGDFLAETSVRQARALADTLLPQFQERYGFGPRAAEAALAAAASAQREHDNAVAQAAVDRYKNQLATLSNAPREPGVTSAATTGVGEPKDEMEALQGFLARRAQTPNVGV